MRTIQIDKNALMRCLILLGFGIFLANLVVSGDITFYINPRFIPLTKFTIGVILLMFITQLGRVFRVATEGCGHHHTGNRSRISLSYLVFAVPLFLAFALPAQPLDAGVAEKKGVTITSRQGTVKANTKTVTTEENAEFYLGEIDPYEDQVKELKQMENIEVTESNFLLAASEINAFPDEYLDKRIELIGFIYKDETLKPEEVVIARYVVSCCTADASVTGFLASQPKSPQFPKGTWVRVKGVLEKEQLEDGEEIAKIKIEKVSKTEPPKDPYVYPLFGVTE